MGNTSLVETELLYQIELIFDKLPIFDIDNVLQEKRADSCLASAACHYSIGFYYSLLGKDNEAEKHFPLCVSLIKQGLSYLPQDEKVYQYSLFRYAILLGDTAQLNESTKVITTMNTDIFRLYTPPVFEHALANILLENYSIAEKFIQKVKDVESKKQELYLFPGVAKALTSMLQNNENQLAIDLDDVLLQHFNSFRKHKYGIGPNELICEPALFIASIAQRRGLKVKAKMKNCVQVMLVKPAEPSIHPSLKKNGRIEFQVDLMPDFILENWS